MMSVIPFTTQLGPSSNPTQQGSQASHTAVFVYNDNMTERQTTMMKECQEYLSQNITILLVQAAEIETFSTVNYKVFVIASYKEDTIRRIRSRFTDPKPLIYLPRAVIEARGYFMRQLPIRSLTTSLSMHNCHVFLVKSCDLASTRKKIYEMSGEVVASFSDPNINVVITDIADSKYCSKAYKRKIAVVSKEWVEKSYSIAREEDYDYFNREAISTVAEHSIKPFYGLHFKIMVNNQMAQTVKKLITENQGNIIFGDENCLTHKVVSSTESFKTTDGSESPETGNDVKVVDVDFLNACAQQGYYMTKRDYREHLTNYGVNNQDKKNPPMKFPVFNMNDMIKKALFEPPQTQMASTQMRQLPDQELRIEQSFEPSQQLYWNDRVPKRG